LQNHWTLTGRHLIWKLFLPQTCARSCTYIKGRLAMDPAQRHIIRIIHDWPESHLKPYETWKQCYKLSVLAEVVIRNRRWWVRTDAKVWVMCYELWKLFRYWRVISWPLLPRFVYWISMRVKIFALLLERFVTSLNLEKFVTYLNLEIICYVHL
jgi:hypothetical protein